jgi:hypothetical protein
MTDEEAAISRWGRPCSNGRAADVAIISEQSKELLNALYSGSVYRKGLPVWDVYSFLMIEASSNFNDRRPLHPRQKKKEAFLKAPQPSFPFVDFYISQKYIYIYISLSLSL